jgi:lipoyl(octanoyl) transferase
MHSYRLHRLGLLRYHDAWRWQQATAATVRDGAPEALALVQHPPVYTFGRRVRLENLLLDRQDLACRGAQVVETDRGGDVTFHGPGQLVAYPILNLRRRGLGAADYVRLLEETMIRTAAAFGLTAGRVPGRPGVWVGDAKLGAVGVRVQGGVTTHGLALNVNNDLAWFDAIVPCGLSGIAVTSLERELGHPQDLAAVEDTLIHAFETLFKCHVTQHLSPLNQPGRGSGGAAHARGARGVSPRNPYSFVEVGAEQRDSDAQRTRHSLVLAPTQSSRASEASCGR